MREQVLKVLKSFSGDQILTNFDYEDLADIPYEFKKVSNTIFFWNKSPHKVFYIGSDHRDILNGVQNLKMNVFVEGISNDQIPSSLWESGKISKYSMYLNNDFEQFSHPSYRDKNYQFASDKDMTCILGVLKDQFSSSFELHNLDWLKRRIRENEVLIFKNNEKIVSFNIFKIHRNLYEGFYLFNQSEAFGPMGILLSSLHEAFGRGALKGYAYVREDDIISKKLHRALKFRPTEVSMIGFDFEN